MRSSSIRKILLFANEHDWQQQIEVELKKTGITVSAINPGRSWNAVLQKSNHMVLLNPPYEVFFPSDAAKWNRSNDHMIFIYTDDERWKQKTDGKYVFYLPTNTHPLELARMLVEKLNLPAVSNKTSYAFSFFQF